MSYPNGTLPKHRRASPADALTAIRNRYRQCRETAGAQVAALQREPEFLALSRRLYASKYKDWHIVLAITNAMWNAVVREKGIDLRTYRPIGGTGPSPREFMQQAAGRVFPLRLFIGQEFELMLTIMETACLGTYGFHIRNPKLEPSVLRAFLDTRLGFYDFDLPHSPLFGDPVGDWPATGGR